MPTDLHDRHEVAHLDGLVDVVGHEQDGLGEVLLEPQELVLEAVADDRVDRPERLVHEHDRRVRGEGPGDAHALALAARELVRVAVAVAARIQPHDGQQLVGPLPLPRRGPAQEPWHDDDVLTDRLVREQADLLDHVADAAPQRRHVALRGILAVDEDPAARRLDQAVDHLERRRLAAAGRADEDADLACRNLEAEVVDRAGGALGRASYCLLTCSNSTVAPVAPVLPVLPVLPVAAVAVPSLASPSLIAIAARYSSVAMRRAV